MDEEQRDGLLVWDMGGSWPLASLLAHNNAQVEVVSFQHPADL